MLTYSVWNNKGGTGKTTLSFQMICYYAKFHSDKKVLALDVCPQANLSELLLGGLEGKGSDNLLKIQGQSKRATIGGYFQDKLPNPYSKANITFSDFVTRPNKYNEHIPANIDLICGDPLLELQSNAVSTLANTQIPGTDTWISIIEWISDLLNASNEQYDTVFLDMNPSFSIFTQMALAATDYLILPTMADDSSRRAIQNAFSLIYGFKLPHPIYQEFAFATKLKKADKKLPKIHLILKNRLTQYMGAASAYNAVLKTIDSVINDLLNDDSTRTIFSTNDINKLLLNVRDFQTTGVVANARGCPIFSLSNKTYSIQQKRVSVKKEYLDNCNEAMEKIIERLM